eukprot:g13645.t1
MILGTRIRRVKYGVTYAESMVKRAGTVNCRAASPWFVVVLRALSMVEVIEEQKELEYHFLEKNCELFCDKDKKEKKSSPRGRGESRGRVLSSKDVEVRFVGQEFSPRSTKDKDGEKLRSRGSDDGANPSGATSSTGAAGAAVSPTTGTTRPPPIQAEIPFTAADCLDAMWRELGVPVKFEPPLTPVEAVVLSDMLVESFEEPESFLAPGFGGPTTEVGGPVAEDAALMRIQRTLHLFQELR